jgi:hypothetical protein
MKGSHGNGDSGLEIGQTDMDGWVRVYPAVGGSNTAARTADLPNDLPVYLSQTLANWFRQRPHLHLRSVVPVCRDGTTVELHVILVRRPCAAGEPPCPGPAQPGGTAP